MVQKGFFGSSYIRDSFPRVVSKADDLPFFVQFSDFLLRLADDIAVFRGKMLEEHRIGSIMALLDRFRSDAIVTAKEFQRDCLEDFVPVFWGLLPPFARVSYRNPQPACRMQVCFAVICLFQEGDRLRWYIFRYFSCSFCSCLSFFFDPFL